ncbi:hypothetical protein AB0B09_32565, partial [Streptomyces sp. NPDC044948]
NLALNLYRDSIWNQRERRTAASGAGRQRPYGMALGPVAGWARELADDVEDGVAVDAAARAPRLRG